MDPQKTWEQLLTAYAAGDWDLIEKTATDLLEALDRGGLPPKVLAADVGLDWDRALARAGCLFALDTVQSEWSTTNKEGSKCGLM